MERTPREMMLYLNGSANTLRESMEDIRHAVMVINSLCCTLKTEVCTESLHAIISKVQEGSACILEQTDKYQALMIYLSNIEEMLSIEI